jgi:hypothetical protein
MWIVVATWASQSSFLESVGRAVESWGKLELLKFFVWERVVWICWSFADYRSPFSLSGLLDFFFSVANCGCALMFVHGWCADWEPFLRFHPTFERASCSPCHGLCRQCLFSSCYLWYFLSSTREVIPQLWTFYGLIDEGVVNGLFSGHLVFLVCYLVLLLFFSMWWLRDVRIFRHRILLLNILNRRACSKILSLVTFGVVAQFFCTLSADSYHMFGISSHLASLRHPFLV